ncbi:MAG: ABC transporter permease [Gammaproteobacteria bacterium]
MRLRHVTAILLRQYYLMRGSIARLLPLFAWVAVDILLWGFITRYLNSVAQASFNFVPVLLGAVLLWDFFTRVMQGVTTSFLEDVWSRSFLNLFATPLSITEYVGGLVLTSVVTSLIGLVVMLILATSIFGLSYLGFGLLLIPYLLILFMFGIALGIAGTALVLRLGPASEWFIWPIPAMISPFVGVFYPLSTLPVWMQYIAHLLPPSYVFEGMRAIILGKPHSILLLLWGIGLACLYILMAAWFFSRVYRHAVRTGLLARYSAESVS